MPSVLRNSCRLAKICSTIFGASPSEGSSSSRIFGLAIKASDGNHLLLAAGQIARCNLSFLGKARKPVIDLQQRSLHFALRTAASSCEEVFLNGQIGKQTASFRDLHDAELDNFIGRLSVNSDAIELDRAGNDRAVLGLQDP